jgi:hypothetical protein
MFKNTIIFCCFIFFINCSDTTNLENCIQSVNSVGQVTDLNNPALINAQVPGGFAELSGGFKNSGILLFNTNGTNFVAFDKFCPQADCNTPMSFENRLLKCSCDESTYSVDFGGAPQTDGFECPAIEYRVTRSGSTIRISNF